MSTDYDAVCDTCRLTTHAGQNMGGRDSLAHGGDIPAERAAVLTWLFQHAWHGEGVRIEPSDVARDRRSDDYERIDLP